MIYPTWDRRPTIADVIGPAIEDICGLYPHEARHFLGEESDLAQVWVLEAVFRVDRDWKKLSQLCPVPLDGDREYELAKALMFGAKRMARELAGKTL